MECGGKKSVKSVTAPDCSRNTKLENSFFSYAISERDCERKTQRCFHACVLNEANTGVSADECQEKNCTEDKLCR